MRSQPSQSVIIAERESETFGAYARKSRQSTTSNRSHIIQVEHSRKSYGDALITQRSRVKCPGCSAWHIFVNFRLHHPRLTWKSYPLLKTISPTSRRSTRITCSTARVRSRRCRLRWRKL